MVVVLSHVSTVYELPAWARLTFDTALNAHASVVFFFVLSGYVLTASLCRTSLSPAVIRSFYARRLFRIYPAIWAVSTLALCLILLLGSRTVSPPSSAWFESFMAADRMSLLKVVAAYAALDKYLVVPVVTVLTELVGSLLLPWLVLGIGRDPRRAVLAILAALLLSWAAVGAPLRANVLTYMIDFVLGAVAFLFGARLVAGTRRGDGVLALCLLVLLGFRTIFFLATTGRLQTLEYEYGALPVATVEAFAAFVLVCLVGHGIVRLPRLRTRALSALGDISYSLYLVHFPIAYGLARATGPLLAGRAIDPLLATAVLALATGILSIGAALLLYQLVELPGIVAGKRVAARLDGALARRPQPAV